MLFVSCTFANTTEQGVFVSLYDISYADTIHGTDDMNCNVCFRGTHIKRLASYGSVSPSNVDPLALEWQGISRVLSHGVVVLGKGNQQRRSGRSLCPSLCVGSKNHIS